MKHIILGPGGSPNSRGLFSFINQYISACLNYDKFNDVHVSFDLVKKSAYYDSKITYTDNAWECFFESKKPDLTEYEVSKTVWGKFGNYYGYEFDFNNIEERFISESIIKKHLILKSEISEKIDEFYEENFKGKKVLGIHKRGTDIGMHHKVKTLEEYFIEADKINADYDVIFISTDERIVVDKLKEKYDNVINYSYESLSTKSNVPSFKSPNTSRFKIGEDALIDAYLLSKTDFLIQTNSNLSNFSLLANSNLKFKRIK